MRLKFDRLINVNINRSNSITIPTDELWKVVIFSSNTTLELNGDNFNNSNNVVFLSSGAKFTVAGGTGARIQGMVFKAVKE